MICKRCRQGQLEPGRSWQTEEGYHTEYHCEHCGADGCQSALSCAGPVVAERGTAFNGTHTAGARRDR